MAERVGLWRFIVVSKDPNLYESLLEDMAAVIGIVIAGIGVAASVWVGWLWADGAASIAIGLLLVADSFVIAAATRSLVAGESAAPPVIEDIRRAASAGAGGTLVDDIKTLQLGPRCILVALTLAPSARAASLELATRIAGIEGTHRGRRFAHLLRVLRLRSAGRRGLL